MTDNAAVEPQGLVTIVGPKGMGSLASGDRKDLIQSLLVALVRAPKPAPLIAIAKTDRRSTFVVLVRFADNHYVTYLYHRWERRLYAERHFVLANDNQAMDALCARASYHWGIRKEVDGNAIRETSSN